MLSRKNFFVVSLIAILSAMPARADVASKQYVDDTKVASTQTNKDYVLTTNKSTGAVETTKFVHSKAANGNNVYSSGATEADKDTSVPSVALVEKIANAAIGDSVALNQGAGNNNRILVTDNSGDVVTGTSTDLTVTAGVISVSHATSADSATSATSATTATTAGSADSVAWTGVTGKPETFAPSAHNQASNTINAMTGYEKASTAAAIDASTDTLNTAIGKLEKALDGKQNTIAANTYDAYGAASGVQSAIEGKLDDGASGYDIDAKSLKVQGAAVLTSHQDISGKLDKNTAITGATKTRITYDAKGLVTAGADLAASDIPDIYATYVPQTQTASTSGAGIIAIADATDISTGTNTTKAVTPAQLAAVAATASGAASTAGSAVQTVTTSGTGAVVTGVSANTNGTVTVTKGNVQIPSGSENATTYASIWVE